MILISLYMIRLEKVCCSLSTSLPSRLIDLFLSEYKDDSQIISRSSTVVVKRRPAVRPGKGKAAMYIAGGAAGPSASTSDKPSTAVNPANNSWHRPGLAPGNLSKRFDAKEKEKEEPSQKSSQVRVASALLNRFYNCD
jgi:protein MPE1